MTGTTLRYPVTQEWCERVRAALNERGAMARLCDELRVPRSQMSEVLGGRYETSDLVEPIHAYLGWPLPLSPTDVLDAGEAISTFPRLSVDERRLIETAVEVARGIKGEQAKRALIELLRLCRSY